MAEPQIAMDFARRLRAGMTPPTGLQLTEAVSQRIRIARPLCIFFMIFVHVNPGIAEVDFMTYGVRFEDMFRFYLADGVGRTSIGLLAIVSGYLAITTSRVFPYGPFVRKRVTALVVPMVLWSAAFLAMCLVGELVVSGYFESRMEAPLDWRGLPNWLFGLTAHPANFPLGFLRDLFLCAVLTPVLVLALRFAGPIVLAVLFAAMVTHAPTPFLGNNIPMFFALGMFLAMRGQPLTAFLDRHRILVCTIFVVYAAFVSGFHIYTLSSPERAALTPYYKSALEVLRFSGAAALWSASGLILQQKWSVWIARLEPYAFFVFCSHLFVSTPFWFIFSSFIGGYYNPAYPLFFIVTPFVAFAGGVILARCGQRFLPAVSTPLNGGRPLPAASPFDRSPAPAASSRTG